MTRPVLKFLVTLLIASSAGSPSAALAQDTTSTDSKGEPETRTWFGWESGLTVSGHATGALTVNHVRSSHLFGVRYLGAIGEKTWTGTGLLGETRQELGVLYGRSASWNWGHASLGSGVAVVWGGPLISNSTTRTTVGLPLQATLYLVIPYRPVDWIGLQVGTHANVNPERSFAGVTVGLVIGELR